jgi:hypothetical protein
MHLARVSEQCVRVPLRARRNPRGRIALGGGQEPCGVTADVIEVGLELHDRECGTRHVARVSEKPEEGRKQAMGIPIDDDPLPPTDEEAVLPEPAVPEPSADPEAPVADALEQAAEVTPGWRVGRRSHDFEVPDTDAIDQALEVPLTDFPDAD